MKKIFPRRRIELSLLCGLICAVLLSMANFEVACEELRHNVLRLHIIANSDSEADQAVKLLVRDRILSETEGALENQTELKKAEMLLNNKLDLLSELSNEVLAENGFNYSATAEIGNADFETREYEDFTLPAGNYRSLIIKLGEGNGKNWWCVVFPAVCIPAAEADLGDAVSDKGTEIAENPQKYVMKFKAVEIYEKLKQAFHK